VLLTANAVPLAKSKESERGGRARQRGGRGDEEETPGCKMRMRGSIRSNYNLKTFESGMRARVHCDSEGLAEVGGR
jgi:hypothetical protein